MGRVYKAITSQIRGFVATQKMFFVATAPISTDGLVNISPKGLDSFRILDDHTVAYADLVGSGIETVAHLKENGRIVLMFCAFDSAPKIVRFHGRGEVVEPVHPEFADLVGQFPNHAGLRCIIRIRCLRVSDSCGFGVPLYEFKGNRSQLTDAADRKGPDGLRAYQLEKNLRSLDGLPGITPPE